MARPPNVDDSVGSARRAENLACIARKKDLKLGEQLELPVAEVAVILHSIRLLSGYDWDKNQDRGE